MYTVSIFQIEWSDIRNNTNDNKYKTKRLSFLYRKIWKILMKFLLYFGKSENSYGILLKIVDEFIKIGLIIFAFILRAIDNGPS